MSLSSRFALDRSGDIGWQFLRPSQRMADPRHFQLPRGDLTSGLSVFASRAERTLVADAHATEDPRRTLFRLRAPARPHAARGRARRDGHSAESGANRLDVERARMFGALQQVRRARARETFVVVPMIAGWHGVCAIKALHMADDLGDDASETIADGNDARAIEFRRLDVEQVVHAAVRELAFEDIERREFARL